VLNLACATGIPGWEKIDPEGCFDKLNRAGCEGPVYTERRMPEFHKAPATYGGSESKFRIHCLGQFLRDVFGVRYNPAKIPPDAPRTLEDRFIHGALLGEGGTCASLPVVYVAVGRRMGYPLKLVSCPHHQFFRWDGDGERFNVETTNTGVCCPPDEHYRTGRYTCSREMAEHYHYLMSDTPEMELAGFLAQRGFLWMREENYRKAVESFLWAAALTPDSVKYKDEYITASDRWQEQIRSRCVPGMPALAVQMPRVNRRFPEIVPYELERRFLHLETAEKLLRQPQIQGWCEWLRREGCRSSWMPTEITVTLPADLGRFEP